MAPKDEYINEIKKISEFPKAHVTMARIRGYKGEDAGIITAT